MRLAAIGLAALTLAGPTAAFAQDAQNAEAAPMAVRDSANDGTLGVTMMRDSDRHAFVGLRATGAINLTESVAIVGEVEGLIAAAERTAKGRIIRDVAASALVGVRLRKFGESPAVPYVQVTAGYTNRVDNGLDIRRSLFTFRSEAGFEVSLNRHLAVRAGGGWTYLFVDAPYRHQFGGTIGVTLSLGKR